MIMFIITGLTVLIKNQKKSKEEKKKMPPKARPPINSDMRLTHGKSIQDCVIKLGNVFLDRSGTQTGRIRNDIMRLQTWVRTSFSPLVLCFFLSDRDDIHEADGTTSSLTQAERDIQLRNTLQALLEQHVLPYVNKVIKSCDDRAVLSQTLIQSLASVRKDWTGFLGSSRFILMSLETESGNQRSGTNQVEVIFRRTFQDVVFKTFRENLVDSLHDIVQAVRMDPSKLVNIQSDAQELVKQFFDEINTAGDSSSSSAAGDGKGGDSSATSEWVHTETRKLEDFHKAFIIPYKAQMEQQLIEVSKKFEAGNDLLALLQWIPSARKHESDMLRSIFMSVYPADFEALHNHVLFEFDEKVAGPNALRLVEHQDFGVGHILRTLELESLNVTWEVPPLREGGETADIKSSTDVNVLLRRFHDLYLVSSTANQACMAPAIARNLPKTVLRSQRTLASGIAAAASSAPSISSSAGPVMTSLSSSGAGAGGGGGGASSSSRDKMAPAFVHFLARIREHGERGWKNIVDSLSSSKTFNGTGAFAAELVQSLGRILSRKAAICKNICERNAEVERAYDEGFKGLINHKDDPTYQFKPNAASEKVDTRKVKYPELIAAFADDLIRGSEQNMDDPADWVRELVSFLDSRDVFLEYYKLKLSRRLLTREFTDQVRDREDTMLARIKGVMQNAIGPVNKVISMMCDLRNAADLQRQFEEHLATAGAVTSSTATAGGAKMAKIDVKVLTLASWPSTRPDDNFIVPKSLEDCQACFERFYRMKHAMKQLRWQAERGNAVIDIAFPKGTKEVTMDIHQAAVLLAVDEFAPQRRVAAASGSGGGSGEQLFTVDDVVRKVGLSLDDVKNLVASMLFMKGMEIMVRPGIDRTTKIVGGHPIELNPAFAGRMRKLRLPHALTARSAASDDITDKHIEESRAQMLDAAIVRVMKSRKEMRQAPLVDATIQSVQRFFIPQPRAIKKQIENLMFREFIERDETEADLYRYKA